NISDFRNKEMEHRTYKICLEEIVKSPEILETRNNESSKNLASRCLESLESKKVPCCGPLLIAQSARSSPIPARQVESPRQEKKLPEVRTFWRSKASVMKTLKRASNLNSNNIINQMVDLHRDFSKALSNTTRQNIEPALRQERTKNEAEFDSDSSNTISDDGNEENLEEPDMEEEVTLSRKRKNVGSSEERIFSSDNQEQSSEFQLEVDLLDIIQGPKIEAEESINKNEIEECWNACLLKKLVGNYHEVIKGNINEDTFSTDFNSLMTGFTKQQFDRYDHQKNYELFWCQDFYTRLTLQLLRKHSALLDNSTSEYQYRDEIINPLLASIFFDVENALWFKTGEIENVTRKRQRNFSKQENERERLGDKHDGILYMNVQGAPVEIGFLEVVGNAFTKIISDKNDDLEKLLKAMMISLWYQHAHQSEESIPENMKLQSYAILVFDNMYIVDEFDAFVIPVSGVDFSQIENIVEIVKKFKIRLIKYYWQLIQKTRKVTRLPKPGLPKASPSKN
ncbi:11675_t:CDS:10, partial [Diversispora eburnea]